MIQLAEAGENRKIIKCLLNDSQEWYKLRGNLLKHLEIARELLRKFKEHDILYMELKDKSTVGQKLTAAEIEQLKPIKLLSEKVELLKKCESALTELDKETKGMIDLVGVLSTTVTEISAYLIQVDSTGVQSSFHTRGTAVH